MKVHNWKFVVGAVFVILAFASSPSTAQDVQRAQELCLDSICIGQSIKDAHFDEVNWIVPQKDITKLRCKGIGCAPENAFRGYPLATQKSLADAVSWIYSAGAGNYNILTKEVLSALREYKYECNPSPRGLRSGERRFFGVYRSAPSHFLTIVGFRLIDGELRVYRIAREYPFRTADELRSLAKTIHAQYGESVLIYDGISSNAPPDVIEKRKLGWFGRSSLFNVRDLADNRAELVLIDPNTRDLLEPTSVPDSGDIKELPVRMPPQCSRSIPIR